MAQSMLMSTSVNGGRALPSLQAGRPAPYPRLPLPSSSGYRHSKSVSVKTLALFGKSKVKTAPSKKAAAPKPKVEDGIFGTSGGIGFTKENELFVGRVAMLGFAASLLGEAITGKGILAQLNLETGIPIYEAEPLLLFFILFTLLGAIGALGDRGRFVDEEATGLDKAVIQPGKGFRGALGLSEGGPLFGFTKSNELFVGRLAQLGVAFSIIGEIITGKGALAQLNIETGVPINEIEPLVIFNVLFFFVAAINPGNGRFIIGEGEEE
ncbi:photosystem II 22 kDa protein 1, chloroplastic-like [Miscanthus floridulus]|uniref:photosystem II 22 kDa protein 1, chloroplastic-like n=1 Tax=Miscanthus floridulus TaxID=154761 RepID=UPI003459F772